MQRANQLLNQLVQGLQKEAQLANQAISLLYPFMLQAQAITEFSEAQHQMINYLSTFVLGETATREFSIGQDLLIDMLAGMLADPNYILYWAFELWSQSNLTSGFMELLSQAYLKLSELNPPSKRQPGTPLTEEDAFYQLRQQQQQASQNPYLQPFQQTQTSPLLQQAQQIQQSLRVDAKNNNPQNTAGLLFSGQYPNGANGFTRPSVPAPPVPASNGSANGWNGIRQAMQQGNSLAALREVGKLSPQDWREMFNN